MCLPWVKFLIFWVAGTVLGPKLLSEFHTEGRPVLSGKLEIILRSSVSLAACKSKAGLRKVDATCVGNEESEASNV